MTAEQWCGADLRMQSGGPRRVDWAARMQQIDEGDSRADAEWLLTNGLGGFSSTMVSGALGRRYHGYLIAALPPPLGRVVMLSGMTDGFVAAPVDGEREPVE